MYRELISMRKDSRKEVVVAGLLPRYNIEFVVFSRKVDLRVCVRTKW